MISSTDVEVAPPWMPGTTSQKKQGDHEEVREDEDEHRALPGAEAAARRDRDEQHGGDRHRHVLGDAEVGKREIDADELGDDR
jgi:hypothetical protein